MPADTRPLLIALPLLVAAVAVLLIGLPALDGPLMLDSTKLRALERVVDEHGNQAVLHTPGFSGGLNRIVAMASFVVNIQAAGELSAWHIRLTNLLIHLAAGLLVFLLSRLLLTRAGHQRWAGTVALGVSILWLLSPLNFNVAMYGIQRMAQLAALFTFAGLALYTAGRLDPRRGRGWLYIGGAALICLPLAVLSKQNGILLLPLAWLVEVYFLHPARPWLNGRHLAWVGIIGAAGGLAALLYLYPGVLNYQSRDFTLLERLLSEPRALFSYLRHLLAPFGADPGLYSDDFTVSTSLLSPPTTALSLAGLAALVVFCVLCRKGRLAPAAFGVAFFLVGHALESSFIPLELYFLHRNYLPGFGVYFALVSLLAAGLSLPRRWLFLALALYAAWFAATAYARATTWSSRATIVSAAVHYHPDSPRALTDYAQVALERGRLDTAGAAIDRVIELRDTLGARVQRLYILCRGGAEIGDGEYSKLAEIDRFGVSNEISQALGNLLNLYQQGGCPRLRIAPLVQSLDELAERYRRQRGNSWAIGYYADSFLYASGDREQAHRRLQARLESGQLRAGLYRLELLIAEGRAKQAQTLLQHIQQDFTPDQLDRYQTTLQDFRQRLQR